MTVFRNGYNQGPADLSLVDADGYDLRTLVSDGSENVNLPGSAWSAARGEIVFSSSREPHDEIYVIGEDEGPGGEERVTDSTAQASYEPSFSPDGDWIVFERHPLEIEGEGVIVRCHVDGGEECVDLSPPQRDCRQPNWSPTGNRIVFQCIEDGRWDLWTIEPGGSDLVQIT
ncbi:MAG: PD40 domain-containing protein, partial [Deltaproteobacteria bacterium]|nr:PD40 domain-containing protein [Deltaproteobacteria bacterium]